MHTHARTQTSTAITTEAMRHLPRGHGHGFRHMGLRRDCVRVRHPYHPYLGGIHVRTEPWIINERETEAERNREKEIEERRREMIMYNRCR